MVSVVVVTPPQEPAVSLEEAKVHCTVDGEDDDALLQGMLDAAVGWIDGPDGWLGRALMRQTLEMRLDAFPGCEALVLRCPPIASVASIKYVDGAGVEQTLATTKYRLLGGGRGGLVVPVFGESWPSTRADHEAVTIRYEVGAADPKDLPKQVRQAILMLVGHWYDNREAASPVQLGEIPMGVEALLAPLRRWG